MAVKAKELPRLDLVIRAPDEGVIEFNLLGTKPIIFNTMSLKAKQGLLVPQGPKNRTERASTLRHEPLSEFRASVYRHRDDNHPTRLLFPGGAFKAALKSAALRLEGVYKTEIAQLTWITEDDVDIHGIPEIFMSVVKNSGQNRTPDIRTRAIVRHWCATVHVKYIKPQLNDKAVMNLVANAGVLCGIGDGRQEKGYGFGTFAIVAKDDPGVKAIMKSGGRVAQDAALAKPAPYDEETRALLEYFHEAVGRMGDRLRTPRDTFEPAGGGSNKKGRKPKDSNGHTIRAAE